MPLPKPRADESREDWIARCVPLLDEFKDNDQRVAVCHQIWDDRLKGEQTVELTASRLAIGDEAAQLLDELRASNALFQSLDGTPNTHFFIMDLTTAGVPSQHRGPTKYQLSTKGVAAALPTLISKPIHITSELDGHFDQGQPPKPIGTFLGAVPMEQADGSVVIRTVGTLWDLDFPDEVREIQASRQVLGGSYEITFQPANVQALSEGVVEIGEWAFSGAAILRRTSAAYPSSKLLVANATPTGAAGDPAPPQPAPDPTPPRRANSMKYPGIPEELEAAVEGLIAHAVKAARAESTQSDLQAKYDGLVTAMDDMKKKHKDEMDAKDAAVAQSAGQAAEQVAALEAQIAEQKASLEAATEEFRTVVAERDALKSEKTELELTSKAEAEWSKLAADHGFDEKQKAEKMPLIRKGLTAGLSIEDSKKLYAGTGRARVRLMAGAGDSNPTDADDMAKRFPVLGRLVNGAKK